jgi:D-mannonate dehydratase
VLRRLLHDLEQGVETLRGDHVRFVDDEHPVPGFGRGVERAVPQVAGIIHAAVASCVEFDDVE